jgi:hypothetical protein
MTPSVDVRTRPGQPPGDLPWSAVDTRDAARRLGTDPQRGLPVEEAARRLATVGPNELRSDETDITQERRNPAQNPNPDSG